MLEQFQKIVNLKDQSNKQAAFVLPKNGKARRPEKFLTGNNETVQAKAIEWMFRDREGDGENSLHKIIRAGKNYDALLWRIGAVILGLIVIIILFSVFCHRGKKPVVVSEEKKAMWSAIVLVNGEVYYGLIADKDKNPVEIANVYYDYDQASNKATTTDNKEAGSLRLVKRGKESYGPDGSMTIYQTQVKYIEILKEDSKVLKAILDHEEIK
ncbi:hypothetical protein L6248_02445 [Candidatus Parcubacteria bacterium]|nr:hypothetical protein [Candidatus Parcubacteria bacterium]